MFSLVGDMGHGVGQRFGMWDDTVMREDENGMGGGVMRFGKVGVTMRTKEPGRRGGTGKEMLVCLGLGLGLGLRIPCLRNNSLLCIRQLITSLPTTHVFSPPSPSM